MLPDGTQAKGKLYTPDSIILNIRCECYGSAVVVINVLFVLYEIDGADEGEALLEFTVQLGHNECYTGVFFIGINTNMATYTVTPKCRYR